jgi:hypothetical protein
LVTLGSHGGGGRRAHGDGQTGGGGTIIERRKTTAWWAFVGRTAEKPPGLVQVFWDRGHSGLRWAQRPDGLGAMVGCHGYRAELILRHEEE